MLEGRVILVTGSSAGIGRAACLRFAAEGAAVIVTSRNASACEKVAAAIRGSGGRAVAVPVDVRSPTELAVAVSAGEEAFGQVDGALNNAGVQTAAKPLADHSEDDFDAVMAVNLRGMWLSMRAEIPALLRTGGGSIVNVASVGGLVAAPGISPYVASKHGIIGLTKAAALDYAADGVRINAIAPGATATAMFYDWLPTEEEQRAVAGAAPIPRVAQPAEIAAAAAWLLSDDASFVTGATLPVDGGYAVP
jgi:NAD(P)-dependent dehydrogenase (short-subunit alcohol dehydrogenase family)